MMRNHASCAGDVNDLMFCVFTTHQCLHFIVPTIVLIHTV